MVAHQCNSGIMHDSPTCKQMPTDGWMGKQNVMSAYNGMLLRLQKDEILAPACNVDEPRWQPVKWNKPVTTGQWLHDSTNTKYLSGIHRDRK